LQIVRHSLLFAGVDSWAVSAIFIATTLLSKVNLDHFEAQGLDACSKG
jgi:hypothetical protein